MTLAAGEEEVARTAAVIEKSVPTQTGLSIQCIRRADSSHLLAQLQQAGPEWRDFTPKAAGAARENSESTHEDKDSASSFEYSGARHAEEAAHLNQMLRLGGPSRPPRILMVTRRHCRKNKYVDIVGEFHLDLVQEFGGAPIVIPRTVKTVSHLSEYLPMDGLIIAEGNDLSDDILHKYGCAVPGRLEGELALKYAGDTEFDVSKDELEFALMQFALTVGCPILSFCRGCQLLNSLRGGTLVGDIETEVEGACCHLRPSDSPDYDSHRHPIKVVPQTPLADWFSESLQGTDELSVNSYHHQANKQLGMGLVEMARAPDGVVEAFYDAEYEPQSGKFVVGLQFHPERMLSDYPGCKEVYTAFGQACHAYQAKHEATHRVGTPPSTGHGKHRGAA